MVDVDDSIILNVRVDEVVFSILVVVQVETIVHKPYIDTNT